MSDQIFTWAIYALFGAAFSAWEASRPARKEQRVGNMLRREIPWTALVFVNETLVITFYALSLPLVFNESVMAAIASTGVHDLPMWVRFIAFFLLFEFCFYWAHRFMHTRSGWRFHRFHHLPEYFFFLITLRATIPHMLMTQLSVIAWVIVLDIAPLWMLGFMLFSSFYGFFQHANVNYRWMRRIEWLMTTPRTHCIHHFIDPRYSCCNLGAITNIWDRVFGTFVDPETVPGLIERKLGVAGKPPMVRTALGV